MKCSDPAVSISFANAFFQLQPWIAISEQSQLLEATICIALNVLFLESRKVYFSVR
jgi:hypothetical protein